ncbi:MAG: flagellar hook-basal body complex protein FliE [Lachnospiraceae bacterium]|nr:flagellar hook-basal body complex protein FliE [Lachnospiraceae bacterium]
MDLAAISALSGLTAQQNISALNNGNNTLLGGTSLSALSGLTGTLTDNVQKADGTMFEALLNTAIDNIKTTNSYLSDAEDEEIKFALGESESTHDLTIALQKASTALQYTVAIRDKVMEAYRELMQIQI